MLAAVYGMVVVVEVLIFSPKERQLVVITYFKIRKNINLPSSKLTKKFLHISVLGLMSGEFPPILHGLIVTVLTGYTSVLKSQLEHCNVMDLIREMLHISWSVIV